ncbi:proline racemase family protein [Alloacidobacterium sp.]|uniref:proline racemase family protein n=1 Tax=Alloacidobacterium sp. TaxID=2951999 RepID=UPI002D5273BB|nr:proline racemase family protein [Alloacidobacterium sp.]HYK35754.1 proline racemase family protein [Alloacidobacterium sp.]
MTSPDIKVVDSHTAGEPTRVVLEGGPGLGSGPLAERRNCFAQHHDHFRSAIINEPRGSDVLVGALLCPPVDQACIAGVIFFNNVGYLGMCGHGMIGLVTTLAYLGRITAGEHKIETPVGVVKAILHSSGKVTIENVPSYRARSAISVNVSGFGEVKGDVAWGGNWFYLVDKHPFQELSLKNVEVLTEFTWAMRTALNVNGISGSDGKEIDHIELFSPSQTPGADSRNFVLCPGKAYDRSPCGTGTSAKMACLYADNKLAPGQIWVQEGILGTIFEGQIQLHDDLVIPSITGSAYVTSESRLLFSPEDPFLHGIRL